MIQNKMVAWIAGWFGWSGGALGERRGTQFNVPGASLVQGISPVNVDTALQLATIWACVERRANIIASLPLHAYNVPATTGGRKTMANGTRLYQLLHDSPNSRMTPFVFWRSMMLNHDMRGNGYARIERDRATGEAIAIWPMPADQVEEYVTPDGTMFYLFSLYSTTYIYDEADVLHIKNLGNGTSGLAKLEFMAASISEAGSQLSAAQKLFGNGGKPTAILMTDKVLRPEQRTALQLRFAEMATGSEARMFVLEADMKYQQLSATPEQLQLLESRQFSVEELCRWFDVPPVLVHHSNVTAWGTGIDSIVEGWYKTTIGPMVIAIEQAIRKRVLTPAQRATMSAEFNLDALLRVSPKSRFELYASAVQNGIMTRDECRALENLPTMGNGAAILTSQINLAPVDMLGKLATAASTPAAAPPGDSQRAIAQAESFERERATLKREADADRRSTELIATVRALAAQKPPTHSIVVNNPAIEPVFRFEAPAPSPFTIVNQVNPTPIDVTVTNDVQPADVTANFEAIVQPADVTLHLPPRKTESTVTRNAAHEITSTKSVESDA